MNLSPSNQKFHSNQKSLKYVISVTVCIMTISFITAISLIIPKYCITCQSISLFYNRPCTFINREFCSLSLFHECMIIITHWKQTKNAGTEESQYIINAIFVVKGLSYQRNVTGAGSVDHVVQISAPLCKTSPLHLLYSVPCVTSPFDMSWTNDC